MNYEITDTATTPPCGWIYTIPELKFEVSADSYDELFDKASDIYTINNRPIPDDLEAQIHKYICLRCPTGVCGSFFNRLAFSARTLMNGTSAFASAMRGAKNSLVDEEEAERRAQICVDCSYNTKNPPCYTCRSFESIIQKVIRGRTTTVDNKINVCGMCGCFLRAMVHVDIEVLRKATRAKDVQYHPEHCWKRKLLEKE